MKVSRSFKTHQICNLALAAFLAIGTPAALAQNATTLVPESETPSVEPTPAPSVRKPAEVPDILAGLESLQIAPPAALEAPDYFAGPANLNASPKGAGATPLQAPDPGTGAVSMIDNPPTASPATSASGVVAEPSLAPPPPGSSSEQAFISNENPGNQAMSPLTPPGFLATKRSFPIGSGRVRYGVSVDAGVSYNNNIYGTSTNQQGDFIFSLQPSFYLETGKKAEVRFLWAPSVLRYAQFRRFDSVNQTFLFSSRYRLTKLQLGLDASYAAQSGLFLNSQGQAKQKTAFTKIFASYPISSKTSISASLSGNGYMTDPGGTSLSGTFSTALDYRYSQKTTVGASIAVGYYGASGASTTYETFRLRLLYNATARLSIQADGGVTFRQSGTNGTASTTVMNFLLSYRPSDKTMLSARFSRSLDADSFTPGAMQIVTTAQASASLKLTDRAQLEASVAAGYSEGTAAGSGSFFFNQANLSLSYAILQDVNVRVFNTIQQRFRDTSGNNYTSNTSGMSLGMRF